MMLLSTDFSSTDVTDITCMEWKGLFVGKLEVALCGLTSGVSVLIIHLDFLVLKCLCKKQLSTCH